MTKFSCILLIVWLLLTFIPNFNGLIINCNRIHQSIPRSRSVSPFQNRNVITSTALNALKIPKIPIKAPTTNVLTKVIASLAIVSKLVINPTISGGLLSGSLHAVTGPDHLAAIFPSAIGKSYLVAMKMGASWGLGHGISATLLGLAGVLLKDKISHRLQFLQTMSTLTESAVGISLLLIGIVGIGENIKESNEEKEHGYNHDYNKETKIVKSTRALFVNGFLHGFSWDGAPSLAPALALSSWRSVATFLFSYCIGTTLIMSATAAAVGEGTVRLGKAVESKYLTRNLSIGSSIVAILVGIYWLVNVFIK